MSNEEKSPSLGGLLKGKRALITGVRGSAPEIAWP